MLVLVFVCLWRWWVVGCAWDPLNIIVSTEVVAAVVVCSLHRILEWKLIQATRFWIRYVTRIQLTSRGCLYPKTAHSSSKQQPIGQSSNITTQLSLSLSTDLCAYDVDSLAEHNVDQAC